MNPKSKRFRPNFWTARLMPILLVILALGLAATLIVVGLSLAGATPGF